MHGNWVSTAQCWPMWPMDPVRLPLGWHNGRVSLAGSRICYFKRSLLEDRKRTLPRLSRIMYRKLWDLLQDLHPLCLVVLEQGSLLHIAVSFVSPPPVSQQCRMKWRNHKTGWLWGTKWVNPIYSTVHSLEEKWDINIKFYEEGYGGSLKAKCNRKLCLSTRTKPCNALI